MKRTYSEQYIIDTDNTALMSADDEDTPELAEKGEETELIDFLDDGCEEESSGHDLMELLSRMKELVGDPEDEDDDDDDDDDDDSDEDDAGITMDADDYHNKAVSYARRNRYSKAAGICMEGLEKFPLNVDLLADTIAYSKDAGDMEHADEYYHILKNQVPFRRWNWRAFSFSFDYLLAADPEANEEECRLLVENYRRYLPYEERADKAESELESALGNAEESMTVLRNALRAHTNACLCALCLADMQMDRGLYEDVIETTAYGIAASAAAQPSINVPYLYYLRTLSKDHLLHRKEGAGEAITDQEVTALKEEFDKVTHDHNRANIDDELLSITDESCSDVYDNYLETTLVGLEHCPMFFTANDLGKINPILADRCTIIPFPSASATRIKSISKKYADGKLSSGLYSMIAFDYGLMYKYVDRLVNHNVTSLRKHQQMIETVLGNALDAAFVQDCDAPVPVTEEMFSAAESAILGTVRRRLGFGP